MRRYFTRFVLLISALFASFAASAEELTDLYEAEIPVAGQEASDRAAASRAALEEVLLKVSGSSDDLQRPELKPFLEQAEQWVQRYQYRAAAAVPGTGATSQNAGQIFWASFDRQTINQRLAEAGLPVWGLNRPLTVLWLVVEDGSQRYIVGGENRPDLQQMINQLARHRGLPLAIPLMDLQDQSGLAVADVWGDFADVILKASERYQADAVLVGRVYTVAADKWQSHWSLYHRGTDTAWESTQGPLNDVIAAGVDGAADQFAKRYALKLAPEATNSVTLNVNNVKSLADYARALHYLQSLDPVAEVQIARLEGLQVNFRLKVRGDPQDLVRSIGWGNTLIPVDESDTPSSPVTNSDGTTAEHSDERVFRYRIAP